MLAVIDLFYRVLYGGLLSRLPERAAVPLGRRALRLLSLHVLSLFRIADSDLAVTLGGVRLPSQLILSSMYYDTTILRRDHEERPAPPAAGAPAAEPRAPRLPCLSRLRELQRLKNPGLERLTFGCARHSLGPRRPMMPSQPRPE